MKLNMAAPNVQRGFISERNEAIEYLELAPEWTREALEEDVKSGAKQLKDCLELVNKHGIGHMVVIRTNELEDGLMAVSYLSSIHRGDWICENQFWNEELATVSEEPDDSALLWMDDAGAQLMSETEPREQISSLQEWGDDFLNAMRENSNIVPIIKFSELINASVHNPLSLEDFTSPLSPFATASIKHHIKPLPYWTTCAKQDICIVMEQHDYSFALDHDKIEKELLRFSGNRHVYVVWHDKYWKNDDMKKEAESEDEDQLPFSDFEEDGTADSDLFCFVLKTMADIVPVFVDEEKLKKYRLRQFEYWADSFAIRFEKGFSKRGVVDAVIRAKTDDISATMQRVLQYVKKVSGKDAWEEYSERDFAVLRIFDFRMTMKNGKREQSKSLKRLEKDLIGMEAVKKQLRDIVEVMKLNRERERMGLGKLNYQNVHLLIGAPGTAKTTVAQLFGKMMSEEGLLPGERFVSVNGAELKGMYVGHSAPKTKFIFERYDVILIDEAYSLTEGDEGMDTFSKEAIAQLILEVEKHGHDKLIMFAGYGGVNVQDKDNKMKRFLDANPGLKSRINSTIYFDSYTPEQMVRIVHKQAELEKLKLSGKADKMLLEYFTERVKDLNFGNGREGRRLVQNAVVFMAERIMKLPKEQRKKAMYQLITAEDVEKTIEQFKRSFTMQSGRGNRYGFL